MPTIGGILLLSVASLAMFPVAAGNIYAVSVVVFLIGCGGGLGTALQTRLMDVAEDAQTLAAALNHSAFNIANAIGPWLGGLAIAHGYGWTSTGWVGSALAAGGLIIWSMTVAAIGSRVLTPRCTDKPAPCPERADDLGSNFCYKPALPRLLQSWFEGSCW